MIQGWNLGEISLHYFFLTLDRNHKNQPNSKLKSYNHAPGVYTCLIFKEALFRMMQGFYTHSLSPSCHFSLPPSPASSFTLLPSSTWGCPLLIKQANPVINTIIQDDPKNLHHQQPFWVSGACRAHTGCSHLTGSYHHRSGRGPSLVPRWLLNTKEWFTKIGLSTHFDLRHNCIKVKQKLPLSLTKILLQWRPCLPAAAKPVGFKDTSQPVLSNRSWGWGIGQGLSLQ